jgi:hypothetical protein
MSRTTGGDKVKEKLRTRGKVTITVLDKEGRVKNHPRSLFRKLFGLQPRKMRSINHNIVTDQGDAMIADILANVPALQKLDTAHGYIQVGTGWTGNSTKANTACNTPTGSHKALDTGYPVLKGSYGNTDDNVVRYRATFSAGDLNASGIDEAALLNGNDGSAKCLAYAEITPVANVTVNDSLQVEWEISFLGT